MTHFAEYLIKLKQTLPGEMFIEIRKWLELQIHPKKSNSQTDYKQCINRFHSRKEFLAFLRFGIAAIARKSHN